MGKKARKTRWRSLAITDDQSDSETSSTTTAPSQSTPRRKYQHDGIKSTRSSSIASENKITFNEDEYTKITTPRQDVLFKKGYLNKPRSYQTQTSTGTSITSTGNSTGNGTPDYQSTDLEYESHFVFPNGLVVSQNGMYYLNGYESYPYVYYNVPTYYQEYSTDKSKRNSAGSLTESTSPNNEEVTSQDLSGGEASNNLSDYSGHHNIYNVVYPGYYVNGFDSAHDMSEQVQNEPSKRVKRRKRKKSSVSQTENQDSTECSETESEKVEVDVKDRNRGKETVPPPKVNGDLKRDESEIEIVPPIVEEDKTPETTPTRDGEEIEAPPPSVENSETPSNNSKTVETTKEPKPFKYNLKPDAEEFVPRAYRTPEVPISPVQIIKVPPNFVPIPLVPFNGQNFNSAFIPPGFPVNFIPPDLKLYPNYVGFVPNSPASPQIEVDEADSTEIRSDQQKIEENCDTPSIAKDSQRVVKNEVVPVEKHRKTIDIATIVHKLEEAAKEQEQEQEQTHTTNAEGSTKKQLVGNNRRYNNNNNGGTYKRNYYNSLQNSPQRKSHYHNNNNKDVPNTAQQSTYRKSNNISKSLRESPLKQFNHKAAPAQTHSIVNPKEPNITETKFFKKSPEHYKRNFQKNSNRFIQNEQHYHSKHAQDNVGKNYSDILKPINPELSKVEVKSKTPNQSVIKPTPNQLPNQWISVSSKKKRKNRPVEENEAEATNAQPNEDQDDNFESYDVNLLVDVIPLKLEEPEPEQKIAAVETEDHKDPTPAATKTDETISTTNTVEEEKGVEAQVKVASSMIEATEVLVPHVPVPVEEVVILDNDELIIKSNTTKKSKKSSQKPTTKRIIITDVDLSSKVEEPKPPVKKIVSLKKQEKLPACDVVATEVAVSDELPAEAPSPPIETAKVLEDKKKNKKKKKKPSKIAASNNSLSSSTATLNNLDDSFELFTSVLPGELEEKTNDEISQEFDKMIQKGIYNSLEEKMKSLNIDETDGFFKSMYTKIPMRDTNAGFAKIPDFNDILGNATTLAKPNSVSEDYLQNLELPTQEGFFLENPGLVEVLEDQTNSKTKIDTMINLEDIKIEQFEEPKTLYPITEAVKEWMCRTRETTPTVEILKSPKTIYKEFGHSVSGSESDTELSENVEDDEVTIFSANKEQSIDRQDLLDFWEDDLEETCERTQTNHLDTKCNEDEEEIEIYESKYGQNMDFLDIQKEANSSTTNANKPKSTSGFSPKAVCCNVM